MDKKTRGKLHRFVNDHSYRAIVFNNGSELEKRVVDAGEMITFIGKLKEESEKVVIPRFVADWIELCKEKANLVDCLQGGYRHFNGCESIGKDEDWLFEGDNQDVVARAWLDGYEVEKVPVHLVTKGNEVYFEGFKRALEPNMTVYKYLAFEFDNYDKAVAVALLIDGETKLKEEK